MSWALSDKEQDGAIAVLIIFQRGLRLRVRILEFIVGGLILGEIFLW